MRVLFLTITALSLPLVADAAPPPVQMFGASWCGPCRTVRAVLDANKVPYEYLDIDIDTDAGERAYRSKRGAVRSIPLVVVGNTKVVGADFDALGAALVRHKVIDGKVAPVKSAGAYGGQSAEWWHAQFEGMRRQLGALDEAIEALAEVAADDVDKARLVKLREARALVAASLQQLDNDASRVGLPRKYR